MTEWSETKKRRIADALTRAGATNACHRCNNNRFSLLDGFFNLPMVEDVGGFTFGGPTVPTVVVGCTKCGYLAYHALGALGLLNEFAPAGSTVHDTLNPRAEAVKK